MMMNSSLLEQFKHPLCIDVLVESRVDAIYFLINIWNTVEVDFGL